MHAEEVADISGAPLIVRFQYTSQRSFVTTRSLYVCELYPNLLLVIYKASVKLVNSFVAVEGRSTLQNKFCTKFLSVTKSVEGEMRSYGMKRTGCNKHV
jgi:hypothetical protein